MVIDNVPVDLLNSPLSKANNQDPNAPYYLTNDQGIPLVADPADLYIDMKSHEVLSGSDPRITEMLNKKAAGLKGDAYSFWHQYADKCFREVKGKSLVAISEGVLAGATKGIVIPKHQLEHADDATFNQFFNAAIEGTKQILEAHRVPLWIIPAKDSYIWLQDQFIPFSESQGNTVIGVAPSTNGNFKEVIDFFVGKGIKIKTLTTLLIGGNTIITRDGQGRPKAIIGEQTLELTQQRYTNFNLSSAQITQMIANDLEMDVGDITFIKQPDFHIDIYVRAGRNGEIFVASQDKGLAMVDEAISKLEQKIIEENKKFAEILAQEVKNGGKPSWDMVKEAFIKYGNGSVESSSQNVELQNLKSLRERIVKAKESPFGVQLDQTLSQIRQTLSSKGFSVQDYPSVYYYLSQVPDNFVLINTMNSRTVTTPEGQVLSIAFATGHPALDQAIKEFEKGHGIDVHFVGKTSTTWKGNKLYGERGGVGCFTNFQ